MVLGKTTLVAFPVPKMIVATVVLLFKAGYILAMRPFIDKLDNLVQVLLSLASLVAVNVTFLMTIVELPELAVTGTAIAMLVGYGLALVALLGSIVYALLFKETPAERIQKKMAEAARIEFEVGNFTTFYGV